MSTLLRMEFFKCRRRWLWLPPLLLLAAQLGWGLWGYQDMDARALSQGWADILYTFPLLNAMMTPVVAAVVASRVADIEHKGQTLKLLETLRRTGALFDAKCLCAGAWMALFVCAQTAVMLVFGMLSHFTGMPPMTEVGCYLLSTLAVTTAITLFQLILSLLMPNQMIGMIVGLIGAFIGLFSMFFPPSIQRLCVWSYYGILTTSRMDWDPVTRIVDYYFVGYDWFGLACVLAMLLLIYLVGRYLFVRKEV